MSRVSACQLQLRRSVPRAMLPPPAAPPPAATAAPAESHDCPPSPWSSTAVMQEGSISISIPLARSSDVTDLVPAAKAGAAAQPPGLAPGRVPANVPPVAPLSPAAAASEEASEQEASEEEEEEEEAAEEEAAE